MNWDRRTFVKFAVGAVLGLHASPLVFKLMDDTAIWTQNWSWVPTPEDGALAFANTVNPHTGTCVQTRVIKGRMKGERLIRVQGNPEGPTPIGGVIPADASALQNLYNETIRVTGPILRDRDTGKERFITWDEALKVLADKLTELATGGKAHTVACLGGEGDNTTGEIIRRFMAALGSPNVAFTPSAKETLALAGQLMLGNENIGFDLMNADYILSFGTPLLEGFGAPVEARAAFVALQDKKGKLVQVEPRCSVTASSAQQWVACKPGTEGALALGVAAAMISSGKYDRAAEAAPGFSAYKALLLSDYRPDAVAALTGVAPDKIKALAADFAKAKAGVAVCGPGPAGEPGRLYDFMAVLALNALKGNLGRKGGLVARKPVDLAGLGDAPVPASAPSLDGRENGLGQSNMQALAEAALAGEPYKLEALILAGGNPVFQGPQAGVMERLARSVPFVVALTPYHDESAAVADLVLPAGHFLEAWGDCAAPYGSARPFWGVHKPLIKAVDLALAPGEVFLKLAAQMGGRVAEALPVETMEEALQKVAEPLGGLDDVSEKGFWEDEPAYGGLSISLDSAQLKAKFQGPAAGLPHWNEPQALTEDAAYPLVMMGQASLRTTRGPEPITPYMIKVLPNTVLARDTMLVVEINPETAHELHVGEGDVVKIESASGGVTALAHLAPGAAPGAVFVPVGLGHSAFGMYLEGKGENFNSAVTVVADAASGLPDWGLTRVNVSKVGH